MNVTEQKQTHRYREQTSGYQWGEGRREEQNWGRKLRSNIGVQTTMYKRNKLQGYTIQHRKYSQYFIIKMQYKL